MDTPRSKEVVRGYKRIKLVEVARAQRMLILLVLALIAVYFVLLLLVALSPVVAVVAVTAYIVIGLMAIAQTARLSVAAGGNVVLAVIGGVCM